MTKESINGYARRLAEAGRCEIIVILYDIILEDLENAAKAYKEGNMAEGSADLTHALTFVKELIASLDMKYEISRELLRLYIYVNGCINRARVSGKKDELSAAADVLKGLRVSFAELAKKDKDGAVMANTQKVYAGLTYGRGSLNETTVSANEGNRGFLA